MVEFPCNIYLFSYTDRNTDRLTGGKTDRQVNKLKYFFRRGEGGVGGRGCGYGVEIHLGRQKGR